LQRFVVKGLRKLSRALQVKAFLTQMNLSRIILVPARLLRRKMQVPLVVVAVEEKGQVLKSGIWRVQKILKLAILIALLIWLSSQKIVTAQIRARKEGPLVVPKEECEEFLKKKGRVRSRKNAGHGATRSQVDSDTKCSSSASDEDLHTHAGNYKLEGIALRRVNNLISKKFFLITNKVTLILFYFFLLYGTHLILLSEISTLELCTRNL
jgi:hypothetical protein